MTDVQYSAGGPVRGPSPYPLAVSTAQLASTARLTGLQKTRDVALTVMAVLVSVVCAFAIYVVIAAGSAIADLGDADPVPTFNLDCLGEVPPPGC